jgi:hypothetical protein
MCGLSKFETNMLTTLVSVPVYYYLFAERPQVQYSQVCRLLNKPMLVGCASNSRPSSSSPSGSRRNLGKDILLDQNIRSWIDGPATCPKQPLPVKLVPTNVTDLNNFLDLDLYYNKQNI